MPIQQLCTVAAATKLNDYAWHLVLEAGRMASMIRPGQFLHIKCGHSRLLRRPASPRLPWACSIPWAFRTRA